MRLIEWLPHLSPGLGSDVLNDLMNGVVFEYGRRYDISELDLALLADAGVGVTTIVRGEYDHNGIVDAADYVVWRKRLGTTYTQNDYNVWRSMFAQTAGSGSGASGHSSVPEPTMSMLLIFSAAGCRLCRGRAA